jgi:hypothetical protein
MGGSALEADHFALTLLLLMPSWLPALIRNQNPGDRDALTGIDSVLPG